MNSKRESKLRLSCELRTGGGRQPQSLTFQPPRPRFDQWVRTKNLRKWGLSLLYTLHPSRAEDAVTRVEVGEALHAVNPDTCEEWIHWCMYRSPINSKSQAARLQSKLGSASQKERKHLATMWRGFVGGIRGGTEEQAKQMRLAHRFIQQEKARCESLMREAEKFGPVEAPDAEDQVRLGGMRGGGNVYRLRGAAFCWRRPPNPDLGTGYSCVAERGHRAKSAGASGAGGKDHPTRRQGHRRRRGACPGCARQT